MMELIKVSNSNNGNVVDARELHKFLIKDSEQNVVGEMFAHWIKRLLEYGFEKDVDYTTIEYNYLGEEIRKSDNQHVSKRDYILTLDCAKQISMLQRNDKGKQARKYFIKCEQLLRDIALRLGTKKHQLEAMEFLQHLLPDSAKKERVNFIKANVIVNKAVSNKFGFPKMLKKSAMNAEMIEVRNKALDDYIKLFEVVQDNSKVKEILYEKYKQALIENK